MMIASYSYNSHNPDLFILDANTNEQLEVIDLSPFNNQDLHKYFNDKFGRKGEAQSAAADNNNIIENPKSGILANQMDRVQINAEIFEGINDPFINTSLMITSRFIYVIIIICCVMIGIYTIAFNPSLIKRTSRFFGLGSLTPDTSKATV